MRARGSSAAAAAAAAIAIAQPPLNHHHHRPQPQPPWQVKWADVEQAYETNASAPDAPWSACESSLRWTAGPSAVHAFLQLPYLAFVQGPTPRRSRRLPTASPTPRPRCTRWPSPAKAQAAPREASSRAICRPPGSTSARPTPTIDAARDTYLGSRVGPAEARATSSVDPAVVRAQQRPWCHGRKQLGSCRNDGGASRRRIHRRLLL